MRAGLDAPQHPHAGRHDPLRVVVDPRQRRMELAIDPQPQGAVVRPLLAGDLRAPFPLTGLLFLGMAALALRLPKPDSG